ncbi:tetratricopeptide repeat protein [Pseudoduganella lutea]|uniref:Tetratricopeptide repeat protein n=1 Tax=Pseudoduganella lutea TaxID=321985 RepID=A0A4P6KT98_9BURK|nr:tetratricopeptide repeat protein [Pseudoduganella lutea]QBE61966.1 tetratricopeptide repeat protein [Pseudoduganella lutea]
MMVGIGLHVLVAVFFAVHAIRSRQQRVWLMILFIFPLLGSLVYFLGIYLPRSRLDRGDGTPVPGPARAPDPTRELREAQAAVAFTPTAQNQMRLAHAQLEAGDAEGAAATFATCLQGAFAGDPDIRLGAARASFACGRHAEALAQLEQLRRTDPHFRPEQTSLLMARALHGAGHPDAARAEFEAAVRRHGSFEAKVEFAIWAADAREFQLAHRLQNDLHATMDRWNRHTHAMNLPLIRRLEAAYAGVPRQH